MAKDKGPVNWREAQEHLESGKIIYRRSWPSDRYVRKVGNKRTEWMGGHPTYFYPCGADENAEDWYYR